MCSKCGANEPHYVPPSLGEEGFYICERGTVENISLPQDRYIIDRYNEFWHRQSLWSQMTFGLDKDRGPAGPILHLYKEVNEELLDWKVDCPPVQYGRKLKDQPLESLQMELVDCFFLVTDAARRSGLTYTEFMDLVDKKLKINQERKWNKSTIDEPVEHDRSEE